MLVVSRRPNEEVVIGEGVNEVSVVIVETRGDKVRLGITAPRNVPVDRREVRTRKREEALALAAIDDLS